MSESDGAFGVRRPKTSSAAAHIARLGDSLGDRDPGRQDRRPRPLDRSQRLIEGATASSMGGPAYPKWPAACSAPSLAERIQNLSTLDLAGLRLQWRNRFGRNAPGHLTKPLLSRILVYRLQADAYGDLDDDLLRFLDGVRRRSAASEKGAAPGPAQFARRIKPGSVLIREWSGRVHRVMALSEGFAWEGKTYRSLSEVARAITGVRWNGPRFFGLSAPKKQKMGRSGSRAQGAFDSGETDP